MLVSTPIRTAHFPLQEGAVWLPSPLPGVTRFPLYREGGEVAKATSLVRYAPRSSFAPHVHGGGEEILVLDGVFSDETGDYPAGSYLRNPPGSSHTPSSVEGCLLFVRLWQFQPGDDRTVRLQTRDQPWRQGLVPGLQVMPLHSFDGVDTALVRWAPHTRFHPHVHPGGEEILVLEGRFCDEHGSYPQGAWLQSGRYSQHQPFTEEGGALILVTVGHLGAETLWEVAARQEGLRHVTHSDRSM